jgi:hypothetical protein
MHEMISMHLTEFDSSFKTPIRWSPYLLVRNNLDGFYVYMAFPKLIKGLGVVNVAFYSADASGWN